MRTDHFAYQQATRVAAFGLLLQLTIGLLMLIWGITGSDTSFEIGSTYVLPGCLVWIGLMVVFHQHRLERLESLERDELASDRGADESGLFEAGDVDVAALDDLARRAHRGPRRHAEGQVSARLLPRPTLQTLEAHRANETPQRGPRCGDGRRGRRPHTAS